MIGARSVGSDIHHLDVVAPQQVAVVAEDIRFRVVARLVVTSFVWL
jgi:hypothetical protein